MNSHMANVRAELAHIVRVIGPGLAALACAAAGCDAPSPPAPQASAPPTNHKAPFSMPMGNAPTPFIRPGIRQPPTVPADAATIEPDDMIIGVSVGNVHRAYVSAAMSSVETHVINDLIGGVPVSVAFCDRTRCARAFTAKDRINPLEIELGGWSGDQMWLRVDGQMLGLNSDDIPYEQVTVETCTWSQWKEDHPDTDVFVGREVPSAQSRPAPATP
jgi:hypothetical protein